MPSIYDFEATRMDGQNASLADYRGKVLLIVNTASQCGLTPQFEGLETLYQTYRDRGLEILGFPCNQFREQDPGEDSEILSFCQKNYGVSFPMHRKIEVNGDGTDPLFRFLKSSAPGILGSQSIKWNFTKFLVDRQGNVLRRFAPSTKPEALDTAIQDALAA